MKFIFLFIFARVASGSNVWSPQQLDYRSLVVHDGTSLIDADVTSVLQSSLLSRGAVGMLSLTNAIPQSSKRAMYDAMAECYLTSDSAKDVMYPDGTKRSTWAASALTSIAACDMLKEAAEPVRKLVGEATKNVALRLETMLTAHNEGSPLIFPKQGGALQDGYSVHEIISKGEQLDHFHVYSSTDASTTSQVKTLDWHTDYGFALAFLPGVMSKDGEYTPSEGFYIKMPDGLTQEVTFAKDDDIVILLGDGVAHINNAISTNGVELRAVPHSFIMPEAQDDSLRLWVGRMMLFPLDAMHSILEQSFGDVQNELNSDPSFHLGTNVDVGYALGCSHSQELSPRLLAGDDMMNCTEDQFMCWHACFNNTEELSPSGCEANGQQLACVDSTDGVTLWDGTHNPKWSPGCVAVEEAGEEVIGTQSPTASPPDEASPVSSKPTESSGAHELKHYPLSVLLALAAVSALWVL